mgnify:CR=1 FL=1
MSTRAEREARLMSLYDSLPGGQTERERNLYGFIPGKWLPNWIKQGYNQSIEGLARQIMNGEEVFKVDQDYDPNMLEDIGATIMSFATPTDFATLALGGGIGGAAVKGVAVKALTKEFAKRGMVKSGLAQTAAVRAVNMSAPRILNQSRAKAVTGATGLGFYSGLQSALGQKITRDDVKVVTTLKDAAKGATLGALTAGFGGAVQKAAIKKGLPKYQVFGAEKGVETGIFGTVSPALEGELPSVDSYIHAAGVIGGLSLKRAVTKKIVRVPKKMIDDAAQQHKLRTSAESEAKVEAREARGKEEWSDGETRVKILTDWTGKERKEPQFKVENLDTNETFNIPKDAFFQSYNRVKDNFGQNIKFQIQKRIWGLKSKLGLSDVEFKEAVDRAAFGSDSEKSFPLTKREGKKGHHSNYEKLGTSEQRYRLLMELQTSKRVGEILDNYRKTGIEVNDVSKTSLLKKALPPFIYEALQGLAPMKYKMTDAISKSGVKLYNAMNVRNSLLFSRLATELNDASYTDQAGNVHKFGDLSGLFKSKKKKKLREQLADDLEDGSKDAINRTREVRKVKAKVYRIARESGLDLAPFLKNYFPKVFKPEVLKVLYKDIDRMGDLDPRILSSELTRKTNFEDNLGKAIENKEISSDTIEALLHIQDQIAARRRDGAKVSLSEAFENLRNNILSERIVVNKNLERERKDIELPKHFYERDAGLVLTNYIAQATKRIAYAELVGKDGKKMYTKIKALRDKGLGKQAEILSRAFDTYTGLIEVDKDYNHSYRVKNFLNDFVNFQVATKIGLGFATIPNITQTFISTALKLGYAPFFKGTFKAIKDKEYRDDIKKNSGAGTLELHSMVVGFQPEQVTKLGKLADGLTKVFGFQGINRVNKLVSAYTALEAAKNWQKVAKMKPTTVRQARRRSFAIRNLREMGIKDIDKPMTAKTMGKVMYEFSRDAQLQKNIFLEPSFFNIPKFQPFILFKRFGYRQGEMMLRWTNQALKDKDFAFFLRLGAAGFAGGAFVNWAKGTLSNLLSGEDIYDDNYRLDIDGTSYTMADFTQGLMAVGAFGVVTDIVASESRWRALEFLAKPAIIQDSFKLYDATLRIGSDLVELGPHGITAQRSAKYIAPVFGTVIKRAARRVETPKQRADRRGAMLTVTKKKIFDYMLRDNDIMVKRIIREWNNAFPERPLMMDDISPAEINKYLMRKHTRLERESIDPATQPKRGKKSSPFALPR